MLYFLLPFFFFFIKLVCVKQRANPHSIINLQWTWTRPMLLVRECSQNRNFGFLSDDLLWTCVSFVGADLGGSDLQWGPWWDSTGLEQYGMSHNMGFAYLFFLRSSVLPPLAHLSFCPQSLNGGEKVFIHLSYCCSL